MKISILGAGAMGMLFGAYLSQRHSVWLIDVNQDRVERIRAAGVTVREADGRERTYHPAAVSSSDGLGEMDLVIVFVKSMFTRDALTNNRSLIGKDTYLMTLQNGVGHEKTMLEFADARHVVIGTTQHNASVLGDGHTYHGGAGHTSIGLVEGGGAWIAGLARAFSECGIECGACGEVKRQIWMKLFTNTAASALTAVLQVPLGFLYENPDAREVMRSLCREAVAVANAEGGIQFDEAEAIESVEAVCRNARSGYTSIYADIQNGCRTEVDTISGAVVAAARTVGVPVPCHEMLVRLIHALEDREKIKRNEGKL